MDRKQISALIDRAFEASKRAYAPYSHFHVGAALMLSDGEIVPGCNVENASYGLTNCAERTAMFAAIARGRTDFAAMVIYVEVEQHIFPCGACRQVLFELAPDIPVFMTNKHKKTIETTPRKLLPNAFDSKNLPK